MMSAISEEPPMTAGRSLICRARKAHFSVHHTICACHQICWTASHNANIPRSVQQCITRSTLAINSAALNHTPRTLHSIRKAFEVQDMSERISSSKILNRNSLFKRSFTFLKENRIKIGIWFHNSLLRSAVVPRHKSATITFT